MTLIKYIYGLVQAKNFWFKQYIKKMTLNAGFKQCKTDPFIIYQLNEIMTVIVIVYVDGTLKIRDKPVLMNNIERIKKEYAT